MEERREDYKESLKNLKYISTALEAVGDAIYGMDIMKKDFKTLEDKVNKAINKNDEKIDKLNRSIRELQDKIIENSQNNDANKKVDELSKNIKDMDTKINGILDTTNGQINIVNNNINKLETRINELTKNNLISLKILEERVNKNINKNQADIVELNSNLKVLEDKINQIIINTKADNSNLTGLDNILNNLQAKLEDFEKKFDFALNEIKKIQDFVYKQKDTRIDIENNEINTKKITEKDVVEEIIVKKDDNITNQESSNRYYEDIKRHILELIKMLDKEEFETIENVDYNEIVKNASDYWLAPCYLALVGWINKDDSLVQKAVNMAMNIEDKNIALFFAILNAKMKKQQESLMWFKKYLRIVDINSLGSEISVLLEAYTNGLFGYDSNGECNKILLDWIEQLSGEKSFCEQQKEYWKNFIKMKIYEYDTSSFPYISKYCTNLDEIKKPLNGLTMHKNLRNYVEMLNNAKPQEINDLNQKMSDILVNIIEEYDKENVNNEAVQQQNGFKQFLIGKGLKSLASQKLIFDLSKKWVIEAYNELNSENIASIPTKIKIKLEKWESYTLDGTNKDSLVKSLHKFYEREKNTKLEETKLKKKSYGILGGAIFFLVLGIFITPFLWLLTIGLGYLFYKDYKKINEEKDSIIYSYNSTIRDYETALDAICLEVINYRKILIDYTEYNNTINYLKQS